ncbi:NlpC/P60 family protein [Streptomyces sp. S.PNR 29]|uniref:C40 family peptidase n=1 Tax=Streptomyces sp. S.PNR 29 TaxID=2973805 RepID=UPI0025B0FEEF|nr:NlpC/P60 family protein [Streptomyces sp. S.PNR 29]MDN0200054.1 NlpC/P60 family protein [Streptomyces sp. S.PNR 29]
MAPEQNLGLAGSEPSRDEVRRHINSLYDRAESDTGNFNATRAWAAGASTRVDPAGGRARGGSGSGLDSIKQRWFNVARASLGPTVPAVLPADRLRPQAAKSASAGPAVRATESAAPARELAPGRPAPELPAAPAGRPAIGPAETAAVPALALEAAPTAVAPSAPAVVAAPAETAQALPAAPTTPWPSPEETVSWLSTPTPAPALPSPTETVSWTSAPTPPSPEETTPWLSTPTPAPTLPTPEETTSWTSAPTSAPTVPSPAEPAVGYESLPWQAAPVADPPTAPTTADFAAADGAWAMGQGGGTYAQGAGGRGPTAVAFARAQTGKPCLWGATGPDSYDCASLTQAAWRAAGVDLPRTAQDQARAGTPVSLTDLQPGDLVFFHADARHVGLCTGDGMMVHAPAPGAVIREEPVLAAVEAAPVHSAVRPA